MASSRATQPSATHTCERHHDTGAALKWFQVTDPAVRLHFMSQLWCVHGGAHSLVIVELVILKDGILDICR
jgi:hypothetical protein